MISSALEDAVVTADDRLTLHDVFASHGPFVLRTVRRLGVRPADVEDVAQEVFVIAHRKFATLNDDGAITAWLFGIVRRLASDYRRRAHVRREVATESPPEPASSETTEDALDQDAARAILDRALDRLDDRKREVFVLFELEEMPMTQVAETVGCPLQTAYSRLYAARAEVKKMLERELGRRSGA